MQLLAFILMFYSAAPGVQQWTRFEAALTSATATDYPNPIQDVQVTVEFTAPSGQKYSVDAFWDGFKIWRARIAPTETGRWTYRSSSSKSDDAGLHAQTGSFECIAYQGINPLYRHGGLRLSADRRYLTHADGKPFFWLGDTVWNGVLKADLQSWDVFLRDRVAKGFNVIQYVATQWRTASGNADGRPAYYGKEKISIDPVFFQWMDERVDAVNEHGLVASPVMIWTHTQSTAQLNPGLSLPDDQIIVLAKYMVARYGAHHVVWMLAGDADYRGEKADRWKMIGRVVFPEGQVRPASQLATMHPGGRMWVQDEFASEPWFSIVGYQSGHGGNDESNRWSVEQPSQHWQKQPAFPQINLEPNYEAHISRALGRAFNAHEVRRAAYWSLLSAPPAGVSYGGHGIWSWETKANPPMTHPYTGVARPWREAMNLPGAVSIKHLKSFFSSFDWFQLRPAQELIAAQDASPARHIVAARSEKITVVYIPAGGEVELNLNRLNGPHSAEWFNPTTGVRTPIGNVTPSGRRKFKATTTDDWALVLKSRAAH